MTYILLKNLIESSMCFEEMDNKVVDVDNLIGKNKGKGGGLHTVN